MGEPIWTTVKFRIPPSWGDNCALVVGLSDALINGETLTEDGEEWTIYGEGNYGLLDDEVEFFLNWMRAHKVPFIASDEPKYEFEGTTIVFDGEREWSGTSSAEQATLTKTEYESIKAGTSEFRTVEEFFTILNTGSCADFPIDHLPAEFPDDEEDDGPDDDDWIQSSLERAAGPPLRSTEFYDKGKLRRT